MTLRNDYVEATEGEGGLFAVKLSDGGWSVADGEGTNLTPPDEIDLAGWHLPVRFETKDMALKAIQSGPDAWFGISVDGVWSKHCILHGAVACAAYLGNEGMLHKSGLTNPCTVEELSVDMADTVWYRVDPPLWWDAIQDHIVADGGIGDLRGHMVAGHVDGIRIVNNAYIIGQSDWPNVKYSEALSHLSN